MKDKSPSRFERINTMTTVVVVGVLHLEVHWTADLKDLGLNTATNGNFFMMCPPKITKMEVSQRERKGQDEKSPKSIFNECSDDVRNKKFNNFIPKGKYVFSYK